MITKRNFLRAACLAACLASPPIQAFAQEASAKGGNMMSEVHPMAKDAMDMKKAREMAAPAMMQKAKVQMMSGDKMSNAMAMETSMAMAMKDEKTKKMVQEHAMAQTADGKPMFKEDQIKAAIRKILSDPAQFQELLQSLVTRETAANITMAEAEQTSAGMVMIPESDMKTAKMSMMGDDAMTMKIAKEMMMHAMMADKDISMAIKGAAIKPSDPAMEKMMKSESMMVEIEKMKKEPSMKMEIAKESMAREMAKPPAMMMPDKKK